MLNIKSSLMQLMYILLGLIPLIIVYTPYVLLYPLPLGLDSLTYISTATIMHKLNVLPIHTWRAGIAFGHFEPLRIPLQLIMYFISSGSIEDVLLKYKILIFLLTLLTYTLSILTFSKMFKDIRIAVIASIAYTTAPRTFVEFGATHLGMVVGITLMPVYMYFLQSILDKPMSFRIMLGLFISSILIVLNAHLVFVYMILVITIIHIVMYILLSLMSRKISLSQIARVLKGIMIVFLLIASANFWYFYGLYVSRHSFLSLFVAERAKLYYHYKYSANSIESLALTIPEILPYIHVFHLLIILILNVLVMMFLVVMISMLKNQNICLKIRLLHTIVMILITITLAMGPKAPAPFNELFHIMYEYLPLYKGFRVHHRWLIITTYYLSYALGMILYVVKHNFINIIAFVKRRRGAIINAKTVLSITLTTLVLISGLLTLIELRPESYIIPSFIANTMDLYNNVTLNEESKAVFHVLSIPLEIHEKPKGFIRMYPYLFHIEMLLANKGIFYTIPSAQPNIYSKEFIRFVIRGLMTSSMIPWIDGLLTLLGQVATRYIIIYNNYIDHRVLQVLEETLCNASRSNIKCWSTGSSTVILLKGGRDLISTSTSLVLSLASYKGDAAFYSLIRNADTATLIPVQENVGLLNASSLDTLITLSDYILVPESINKLIEMMLFYKLKNYVMDVNKLTIHGWHCSTPSYSSYVSYNVHGCVLTTSENGSYIRFVKYTSKAGKYILLLRLCEGPRRGLLEVYVNGKKAGIVNPNSNSYRFKVFTVNVSLSKGLNVIKLVNIKSQQGKINSIDFIALIPREVYNNATESVVNVVRLIFHKVLIIGYGNSYYNTFLVTDENNIHLQSKVSIFSREVKIIPVVGTKLKKMPQEISIILRKHRTTWTFVTFNLLRKSSMIPIKRYLFLIIKVHDISKGHVEEYAKSYRFAVTLVTLSGKVYSFYFAIPNSERFQLVLFKLPLQLQCENIRAIRIETAKNLTNIEIEIKDLGFAESAELALPKNDVKCLIRKYTPTHIEFSISIAKAKRNFKLNKIAILYLDTYNEAFKLYINYCKHIYHYAGIAYTNVYLCLLNSSKIHSNVNAIIHFEYQDVQLRLMLFSLIMVTIELLILMLFRNRFKL